MNLMLTYPKKTLIVPVGVPGSGKSTLLAHANVDYPGFRHGADDVRRTMFGDVSVQGSPMIVHDAARTMLEVRLAEGLPAAYDATNISPRDRFKLLVLANEYGYFKVALVSEVPVEVAKLRNELRRQPVPEFVIDRMAKKLVLPTHDEGFDDIVHFDQFTDPYDVKLGFGEVWPRS